MSLVKTLTKVAKIAGYSAALGGASMVWIHIAVKLREKVKDELEKPG